MFVHYSHEARPYAMLLIRRRGLISWRIISLYRIDPRSNAAGWFFWWRRLSQPYHHIFLSFFIVAQLLCVLVFCKDLTTSYFCAASAFAIWRFSRPSATGCLIAHAERSGTIAYNVESSVAKVCKRSTTIFAPIRRAWDYSCWPAGSRCLAAKLAGCAAPGFSAAL